jgi:hypothetical protein
VVSFTPRPLYPRYPLDKRLGGHRNRSGPSGKEKNSQSLPGIEPPIIQQIIIIKDEYFSMIYQGKTLGTFSSVFPPQNFAWPSCITFGEARLQNSDTSTSMTFIWSVTQKSCFLSITLMFVIGITEQSQGQRRFVCLET